MLEKFGKKTDDIKAHTKLWKDNGILDEINENTKPFLLSALVVNGNIFLPGNPFFDKWMPNTNEKNKSSDWNKELEKIWEYYCK